MTDSINDAKHTLSDREEALSYLGNRLNIVTPMLNRFIHLSCKEIGLRSPRDLWLLSILSRHPINQAHIIKMMEINAPTLSKQIDALVQGCLLTRQASEEDRRSQILSITPQGKQKLEEAAKVNELRLSEMFTEASDEQLNQLREATDTFTTILTSRMEKAHKSHSCPWKTTGIQHHTGETHE